MSDEDGAEVAGDVVVHAEQIAVAEEWREHGAVLGADPVAGKQYALPPQRDRPNLVFNWVGIEIKVAIVEDAD